MQSVSAGLARDVPSEVRFDAVVTGAPHFFYGSRTHAEHESFDVRSADGIALRVVDNVVLAPPVAVCPGDRITVQGELVPGARGGPIVHWTHHDPSGRHADGFIDWNGRRYA
jgi:hypothetical protein